MTSDARGATLHASLRVRRGDLDLDLELTVEPGETLALVGPNGAGKTTVVDLLAGLLPLDGGHIRLGSVTLDDPDADIFVPVERRRVGVVFQQHLLFDHLSARANVAFGVRATGTDRATADQTADSWLAALDVADVADRRPHQLSGGQAQRVAIARTLAVEPSLLLLDEPLAALDVQTRVEVRRVLARHLGASGRPTILISHDPEDALLLADRFAVIEHGTLTQTGAPDEIRRRPASRYVAALAGTNLVPGVARSGRVTVGDEGAPVLHIADTEASGDVLCAIRPEAVSVHLDAPSGSLRNVWRTSVELVEPMGDTARVTVGAPLPLAVDITAGSAAGLGLRPGAPVWVAIKATEIDTHPA